jgi:hypothetical protein
MLSHIRSSRFYTMISFVLCLGLPSWHFTLGEQNRVWIYLLSIRAGHPSPIPDFIMINTFLEGTQYEIFSK